MDSEEETFRYVAITNIPYSFKTADLRSYFSEYMESNSFECFHYRHRPEKKEKLSKESRQEQMEKNIKKDKSMMKNENVAVSRHSCCCVVKTKRRETSGFIARYHNQNWINANDEYSNELCEISLVKTNRSTSTDSVPAVTKSKLSDPENSGTVHEDLLAHMPEMNPPRLMPQGNVGTPTSTFLNLIQQCLLPHSLIQKLNLKFPSCTGQRLYSNVGFEYYQKDKQPDAVVSNKNWFDTGAGTAKIAVLSARSEKSIFPINQKTLDENDSVISSGSLIGDIDKNSDSNCDIDKVCQGSTTGSERFNEKCNHEIDKININSNFEAQPSTSTSTHPSDSETCTNNTTCTVLKSLNTETQNVNKNSTDRSNYVLSQEKSNEQPQRKDGEFAIPKEPLTNGEIKRRKLEDKRLTRKLMAEGIEEHLIGVDRKWRSDEDAEEWDRHEASEDDPTNQGRCKERLYEEEIEQPWEKGGPGVVFWTDAIYWQAKEGDFDEQTTDDLDVDFSAYEESGAGDKDIKDFLKIRQEQRWRNGTDNTDIFSIGIGRKVSTPPSQHKSADKSFFNFNENAKQSKLVTPVDRIGEFEKHSKGIGRKIMEKQGWSEGQGLGTSDLGLKVALRGEGKKPFDKQGLGFIKSRPVRYGIPPINKTWTMGPRAITTVYDDPRVVDPQEPLHTRGETSTLKHRPSHIDKFNTKNR